MAGKVHTGSVDALNAFLRSSKSAALKSKGSSTSSVVLVMGNEAADLDSMACAVSYAFAMHVTAGGGGCGEGGGLAFVPWVGVPREDFGLRTDAKWLFDRLGVDVDAIVFKDDVDPLELDAEGRLAEVVLVDHNLPAEALRPLLPRVTRVIDHHQDEARYPAAATTSIALVGSCATLVTEAIIEGVAGGAAEDVLAPGGPVPCMLAAAVLLDTQNLDAAATRATARDEAALRALAAAAGVEDPAAAAAFYETLKRERFDQKGLSPRDLLRRDYKQWVMGVGSTREVSLSSRCEGGSLVGK